MNKYLLEIGTEELPYKFIPSAITQLKNNFEKFLTENKLGFTDIKTFAGPRRLTLIIDGLPDKTDDTMKIVKGPIANIAYDQDGNLTPAAVGFAKKNGIDTSSLYLENNYVHAKIEEKGKSAKELLIENVPTLILSLTGSHFMRWSDYNIKFQRPIRNLVSLFNDENAEIEILDVKSGETSFGHRFSQKSVKVDVNNYENELLKAHVIADAKKRKAKIVETSTLAAKSIGADIVFDEDLLDEVTYLTEWPVPVICDFDEKYLRVPDKVTVTVMATHQRYFPLYKDGKLLNKFITTANFVGSEGFDNIKAGNERVVTARLEDGIFFFEEDTAKPLESYLEKLKGMTFQKGMGSVYDKTMRTVELSKHLAAETGTPAETIERTALLCKADLATSLVFEFTELQGFIGCDYAKHSGENDKVAEGIKEHYFPLNANSDIACGIEGKLVGIADKVDTVTVIFASGAKISGSQDPLGVRRAALGVLKTIMNGNVNINLSELIRKSVMLLPVKPDDERELFDRIRNFYIQRLIILLSDNYDVNIIEAGISNIDALESLNMLPKRISDITEITKRPSFEALREAAERIIRIIKDKEIFETPEINLFKESCENEFYKCISEVDTNRGIMKTATDLEQCIDKIAGFFDKVLVMDSNEEVKNNRIKLLTLAKSKFNSVCDFSKLPV